MAESFGKEHKHVLESIRVIQQKLRELIDVQDAEKKCGDCCLGLGMCRELLNTNGYTYEMILQSNGWIKIEYTPCEFNGGREIEEIRAKRETEYKQLELQGVRSGTT